MAVDPDGGDPACWLDHVCDICGRFVEDPAEHRCAPSADAVGDEPVSRPASGSPEA